MRNLNEQSMGNNWVRVKKGTPCIVCGREDWCLVSQDQSAAICPRTSEGSVKFIDGSGYLHKFKESDGGWRHSRSFVVRPSESQDQDFNKLVEQYEKAMTLSHYGRISADLGVSVEALKRLHVGFCGNAYSFPTMAMHIPVS